MLEILDYMIMEVEVFYYLCRENKGSDQLHSYRAADLCFCFRIFIHKVGFLMMQLIRGGLHVTQYNI